MNACLQEPITGSCLLAGIFAVYIDKNLMLLFEE